MKEEILFQRELVESIMTQEVNTRNSDKDLVFSVLRELGIAKDTKHGYYILKKDIDKMPAFESITRIRRKIQNDEGRLLPTNPEVLKERRLLEAEMQDIHAWYPKPDTAIEEKPPRKKEKPKDWREVWFKDDDEDDPDEAINKLR